MEGSTYWETERMLRLHLPIPLLADGESVKAYTKLKDDFLQQGKALDAFVTQDLDRRRIQPLRNRLAETRNVLNDVRREVGLPVEGGDAESPTQDQPQDSEPSPEVSDQPPTE